MTPEEYMREDAVGLAALVARGEVSAAETLEAAIAQEAAANPRINAIAQRLHDFARAEVAAGLPEGPLRGVPYLLKDVGARLKGTPTGYGARMWPRDPAAHDSEVSARLRRAGMAIFGKTATPELGLAAATETTLTGDTRNPWDPERSPGGSSGGAAAAVAAGIAPAAHASDGGGSIRIPAACCGLFGLKPTRGRISFAPDAGEGWGGLASQHAVTRSVRDSAVLLDVTAGPVAGDPYAAPPAEGSFAEAASRPPKRLRVALQLESFSGEPVEPACREAALETARLLERLGHHVEEARPTPPWEEVGHAIWVLVAANAAQTVRAVFAAKGREPRPEDMERVTWGAVEFARTLRIEDYPAAVAVAHRESRRAAAFHRSWDVLLSPTLAAGAQPIGAQHMNTSAPEVYEAALRRLTAFTQYANVTGQPSMSVPLAMGADGMPFGSMFTGPVGSEAMLLSLAAELELAAPWAARRPGWPG